MHDVGEREDADRAQAALVRLDHDEPADFMLDHDPPGALHKLLRADGHDLGGHHLPDHQAAPVFPVLRVEPRVDDVGTRDDPRQPAALIDDDQGADVVLGHHPGGVL